MLKVRAEGLEPHEKLVSLSFDGMRLTKTLRYSKETDIIVGYEDLDSHGKSSKVANEGVVIMVQGLTLRWKQILGYFVASNCISAARLGPIIEEAIGSSAVNKAVNFANEQGEVEVPVKDWEKFSMPYFKRIPSLLSYHHFHFTSETPGTVHLQKLSGSPEETFKILKTSHPTGKPAPMTPAGPVWSSKGISTRTFGTVSLQSFEIAFALHQLLSVSSSAQLSFCFGSKGSQLGKPTSGLCFS